MTSSLYLATVRSYCPFEFRGSFILPLLYVIGFAQGKRLRFAQDLDLGIKFWAIHWPMWRWQVFIDWKISHGCNFSCLGGCNPKYIRFLMNPKIVAGATQPLPFYHSFNGCEKWHALIIFFWVLVDFLFFFCHQTAKGLSLNSFTCIPTFCEWKQWWWWCTFA